MKTINTNNFNANAKLVMRVSCDAQATLMKDHMRDLTELDVTYILQLIREYGITTDSTLLTESQLALIDEDPVRAFTALWAIIGCALPTDDWQVYGAEYIATCSGYKGSRLDEVFDGVLMPAFFGTDRDPHIAKMFGISVRFTEHMQELLGIAARTFTSGEINLYDSGTSVWFGGRENLSDLYFGSILQHCITAYTTPGFRQSRWDAAERVKSSYVSQIENLIDPDWRNYASVVLAFIDAACWIEALVQTFVAAGSYDEKNPLADTERLRAQELAARAQIAKEAADKALAKYDRQKAKENN